MIIVKRSNPWYINYIESAIDFSNMQKRGLQKKDRADKNNHRKRGT